MLYFGILILMTQGKLKMLMNVEKNQVYTSLAIDLLLGALMRKSS